MKQKRDLIIVLLPIVIILVLVIIKSFDKNSFDLSANEVHELSLKEEHILSVEDYKNKSATSKVLHQLVDLRSTTDFESGHLKGAIDIPMEKLLESEDIEPGRIAVKYVLYSENVAKTTKAWTILKQKGYKNIFVLDIPKEYISESVFDLDNLPPANEKLRYTFQPNTVTGLN
jgi:rhodanese-related sulfurtransferase